MDAKLLSVLFIGKEDNEIVQSGDKVEWSKILGKRQAKIVQNVSRFSNG